MHTAQGLINFLVLCMMVSKACDTQFVSYTGVRVTYCVSAEYGRGVHVTYYYQE